MFTPNRKRNPIAKNRRSVANLTPRTSASLNASRTSLLRKSLAPKSSVGNVSFVSSPTVTTSFASLHHNVQSYETSIPVLVTEAITLAEDISEISVQIGANGWSWLVCGQKLFVWTHKHSSVSKIPICKEISLRVAADDDRYSSALVAIDYDEDTGCVTALAVSLLGQTYYWSNLLVSTAPSGETSIDLSGQNEKCFNVVAMQNHGHMLSSSTGNLFHIFPTQNNITWKQMNTSKHKLAGLGRRFSSFFFSSASQTDNVLQLTATPTNIYGEFEILMLTHDVLQHWRAVFSSEREANAVQLAAEVNLNEALITKLKTAIWGSSEKSVAMWPLDVRRASRRGHVAVLVAVAESDDSSSSTLYYAVCIFSDLNNIDDVNIIKFTHTNIYDKTDENVALSYKLLMEDPMSRFIEHLAIWSNERIILKSLTSATGDAKEDDVPFDGIGDRVLGAGHCDGRCLFLSAVHGLIMSGSLFESCIPLSLEESILNSSANIALSPPEGNKGLQSLPGTPVMTQARMDQLESSSNCAQKLQAAFLYYCRRNLEQAQLLVSEVFPHAENSNLLDNAVVVVSGDLLDDYPAQDPRWAESVPRDVSSESAGSLILLHQLEDKQKAHSLFLKFLSEVDIWSRLSNFTSGRDRIVTQLLLLEHVEKLHASISLLHKHQSHQGIVDAAIRCLLNQRDTMTNVSGLTPRDFFYREISRIDEIFESLFDEEERALLKPTLSPRERATIVTGVNAVMEAMLGSVRQYRRSHTIMYEDVTKQIEFIPWTIGSGRNGIRNIVLQQHKLTIDRGLPEAEDDQQRALFFQSLVTLADLVLAGYQEQIAFLSRNENFVDKKLEIEEMFEKHRNQLVNPILQIGQIEKAASLAEKFLDFDILVQICDKNEDKEKLKKYMKEFAAEGFPEFLFDWFLQRQEYRKLLSCCDDEDSPQDKLDQFLQQYPTLAWKHCIKTGNYMGAHDNLMYLATNETDSASYKKHYLSIGKLAAVFSDEDKDTVDEIVEDIDNKQMLIRYQDTLPSVVVDSLQINVDSMPVFPPRKLIELYVGDVNENANEVDFKKAFELLQYLPGDVISDDKISADELKLNIWCKLILRDSWGDVDTTSDPFESCSHTILFKTLKLAYSTGLLSDILPDIDTLLMHSELQELRRDSTFEYFIRASFERVQRSLLSAA